MKLARALLIVCVDIKRRPCGIASASAGLPVSEMGISGVIVAVMINKGGPLNISKIAMHASNCLHSV